MLLPVALNTTVAPEQTFVEIVEILTLGVTVEFVNLIPLLFAVTFCKQGVAFDVKTI